jgi:hypothetical protein
MQVHHALATAGKVALGCLVLLAFAALAIVGANVGVRLGAGSLRAAAPAALLPSSENSPSEAASSATPADILAARFPWKAAPPPTPAEVLAARFPSEDNASQPPTFSAASVIPRQGETYDLGALSGMAMVEPAWPAADGNAPAAGTPEGTEPARQAEPPKAQRPSARSPNVVNDAMIASIRRRLKLTAEQDKLWPPVEAALRKIVYTRAAMNPQRGQSGGSTAYIDPTSPEVQELKSAAMPLLMRLNGEQKREVRELAFVMGLEAIASQF